MRLAWCVVTVICLLSPISSWAFGQKYYIQLGSCYLQKCVADKVAKAQAHNWPVLVHRQANNFDVYEVISALAHDETDVDIYITSLKANENLKDIADLQANEIGYFITFGVFDSVALAYNIKAEAEKILKGEAVTFRIKRRSKKEESSKILIGPYYSEKSAREQRKKVRETPEFPHAFLIRKE